MHEKEDIIAIKVNLFKDTMASELDRSPFDFKMLKVIAGAPKINVATE